MIKLKKHSTREGLKLIRKLKIEMNKQILENNPKAHLNSFKLIL